MTFDTEHKFCMNIVYILTITNVAAVQDFEVISNKFNIVILCTCGNWRQNWITKEYNY